MRTMITKRACGLAWDERTVSACIVRAGITELVIEEIVTVERGGTHGESGRPLAEDIRSAVEMLGGEMDMLVSCLDEADIMYRRLTRPFADRRKIMETIGPEVETLLPALDSRPVFDYVKTGRDASGAHVIQALCAKSSRVDEVVQALKAASLDPETVDCPSAAVATGARRLLDLPDLKEVLVLHVGLESTSVAVVTSAEIRFLGALPKGYRDIAPERGRAEGAEPAHEAPPAERPAPHGPERGLADLLREIFIMLEKAGRTEGSLACVATGYATKIPGFEEQVARDLGMEVLEPVLKDVQYPGDMASLKESFLAASLAVRGVVADDPVNFWQGGSSVSRRIGRIMGTAGPWVKAALVLLLLWTAGLVVDVVFKARTDAELKRRISSEFSSVMPKGTPMVDPLKQMEQYASRLKEIAGGAEGGAGTPLGILKDLSAGIPAGMDVVIDSVNIDAENVTISGSTGTYDDVEKIKELLSGLPYLREVKIVQANVDKNDQKVRMRLTCKRQV
ncbi:MAG TPA: PilN domain-containing protein [Deltaproteobacteria bacterium]|nr:PilN domain-containing protein [Deltaproteobacteria bacterium]HPP79998.1 PilN domain-containing protein [Deltaproteobacteria bacterium]